MVITWLNKGSLWAPTRRCLQEVTTDKTNCRLISIIRIIWMKSVTIHHLNYLISARPTKKFICQVFLALKITNTKNRMSQCSVMEILDSNLTATEDLECEELAIEFNINRCHSLYIYSSNNIYWVQLIVLRTTNSTRTP